MKQLYEYIIVFFIILFLALIETSIGENMSNIALENITKRNFQEACFLSALGSFVIVTLFSTRKEKDDYEQD